MISIFGSSGFIGSRFIQKYQSKVIPIDRETSSTKSDDVVYFISTVHNYNIFDDPYIDINTNLTKLIEVLEEYRKSGRTGVFNFVSSWFVYGKTTDLPAHENSPCNPTGFYSITKHAAEKMLISYCQTYGIKYRIFRLTNVIGVGDKKVSKKKNALQYMINNLKSNSPIHLYNNGTSIRDFMDVDDVCDAINCCLEKAPLGEIINISNSEPHSIGELITYCKDKLKSTSEIIVIPPTDFHQIVQIDSMWLNNSKLLSYGYVPKINVFESLDKIMES
jgi:nucleoside-diphosphate-sugar epimerase